MTHKPQTRKLHQRVRHVIPFVLVIVMFVIAGNLMVVFQKNANSFSLLAPAPTPTPAPHATYTSDKLGISFTYLTIVSDRVNFYTREIGDTVYLYYNPASNQPFTGTDAEFLKTVPGHGYSVEVFNKDPQQSLIAAIKQQFLTGYAENECLVKPTRYGHPREDESYQTATIEIPHSSTDKRIQVDAKIARCPNYVTAFGVSYFMMDPKHPNKLLFIKLGQDNIPSGVWGKGTWDKTITVFK